MNHHHGSKTKPDSTHSLLSILGEVFLDIRIDWTQERVSFFIFHFLYPLDRMDASDIIRKLQNRTIFAGIKAVQQPLQPTANFSTCCITGATLNFQDYQLRYSFYNGVQYCSTCVTSYPSRNVNDVCGCSG